MKTERNRNNKGFTLIEVLIALVVFSFGILGIASMQITAIRGNDNAIEITDAATLAQSKVEALRACAYDDASVSDAVSDGGDGDGTGKDANDDGVDDSGNNFGLDDNTPGTADHSQVEGNYTILWNIAEGEPVADAKRIRVFVTWSTGGTGHQISMDCVKVVM